MEYISNKSTANNPIRFFEYFYLFEGYSKLCSDFKILGKEIKYEYEDPKFDYETDSKSWKYYNNEGDILTDTEFFEPKLKEVLKVEYNISLSLLNERILNIKSNEEKK